MQTGNFGGAVFKVTQEKSGASKGLTTVTLISNAFKGAPSYATCKSRKALDASAAKLSSRTLQLLHATAHGKFRTRGRYGAATVLGTKWTIADRCDGTLTRDITDSVLVSDFVAPQDDHPAPRAELSRQGEPPRQIAGTGIAASSDAPAALASPERSDWQVVR